jgi:hypothetical protein
MIVAAWALAFALTCAVELVVVARLVGKRPRRRLAGVVLAAQLATHPGVWLAMATLPGPQLVRLAAVELAAVLVEAAIYARAFRLPRREAFALSAAANAGSLLVAALASALAGS